MIALSGAVIALAVLLWPTSQRRSRLGLVLALSVPGVSTEAHRRARMVEAIRMGWRSDPVELVRAWAQRRRPTRSTEGVTAVLEGIAPALEVGLPPPVAAGLAGASLGSGLDPVARELVTNLRETGEAGLPLAPVWRSCALATGSADIGFVAAAWQLSEVTGAPLADAVQRSVMSLREASERDRRVQVAVAGPKATVVVLTVLPLTGPAFGLVCGVPPVELYLGSPISTVAAVAGVLLIGAGRMWCRRLIASVTVQGRSRDS